MLRFEGREDVSTMHIGAILVAVSFLLAPTGCDRFTSNADETSANSDDEGAKAAMGQTFVGHKQVRGAGLSEDAAAFDGGAGTFPAVPTNGTALAEGLALYTKQLKLQTGFTVCMLWAVFGVLAMLWAWRSAEAVVQRNKAGPMLQKGHELSESERAAQ